MEIFELSAAEIDEISGAGEIPAAGQSNSVQYPEIENIPPG